MYIHIYMYIHVYIYIYIYIYTCFTEVAAIPQSQVSWEHVATRGRPIMVNYGNMCAPEPNYCNV